MIIWPYSTLLGWQTKVAGATGQSNKELKLIEAR